MEIALKTAREKYDDQVETLSKIAQQKYENQEKQTEEYRRAFCASERQVTRLKKEKMEISRQLSVEKEALELAMKQCEEYLAASSRLANDLSVQSTETGELLLQKSETIKKISSHRDRFPCPSYYFGTAARSDGAGCGEIYNRSNGTLHAG
jgi:hypothetical protein